MLSLDKIMVSGTSSSLAKGMLDKRCPRITFECVELDAGPAQGQATHVEVAKVPG